MVADFRAQLEAVDGVLHEAPTLDAARELARGLIGSEPVARWADKPLDGIAMTEAPAAEAAVSLVVADAAIADTGQIAFVHGPGRDRGAGVLPDRQVALVRREDLVRTLAEALGRWYGRDGAPPANVVLTAGPSRTADIELQIMLGVHGPRALDVILYG